MDNEKKTEILEIVEWQAACRLDCWSIHRDHDLSNWQHEVANDYTRRGYREWVESHIIANHYAPEFDCRTVITKAEDMP